MFSRYSAIAKQTQLLLYNRFLAVCVLNELNASVNIMDWLILISLAIIVWFWVDSLRALDVARHAGKLACKKYEVQFLDDAISGIALALVRDDVGRLVIRRTYRFEFSETGDSRLEGRLTLLGKRVESVTMEPYQILS